MNGEGEDPLGRLSRELAGHDPLLAQAIEAPAGPPAAPGATPAQVAARGPRASARPGDYELLVDTIYEGYLLHYAGAGRVVRPSDPDLALLLGDQLYAIGLARLAELGDLEAVSELADVISLAAQARAAGQPATAEAVWTAGATAVGWGPSREHLAAKELARSGRPEAADSLLEAARRGQDHLASG
jgi:hypothetical protein